jgi:hypothetical protein
MVKSNLKVINIAIFIALSAFFLIISCAEVQINTIPPPSAGAKLRIFIQPSTGMGPRHGWGTPHKKFEEKMYNGLQKMLANTDMYEVVPKKDVRSVLGRQIKNVWHWERNDWDLAKKVGRALYAEYAMIVARAWEPRPHWRAVLINIETDKKFAVFSYVTKIGEGQNPFIPVIKASYRAIFQDAKKDLLETAIRIGKRKQGSQIKRTPTPPKKVPPPIQMDERPTVSSKKPRTLASLGREVDLSKAVEAETPVKGRTQLAVYDLDSEKHLKIVAIILSEALREELFRMGKFILVNRENMNQVLQEVKLGQTGLIDEKQAIQAGKVLAVKQIILGRLASIGKSSLIQAKRIDTETHNTMSISSLKCKKGREEVLLDRMKELAGKLVQAP